MDVRRRMMRMSGENIANLADIAFWNNGKIYTTSANNWNEWLGTPIGVVVIPSGVLPDGMARIMSLNVTDAVKWGDTAEDTVLPNYSEIPYINSNQQIVGGNFFGYLPSDVNSGTTSIVDPEARYHIDITSMGEYDYLTPSPYSNGKLNPDYCMELSGGNMAGDFNGLSNTKILVGLGTRFTAANSAYDYAKYVTTAGVSDCEWYLPAAGELGFMVARFGAISNAISRAGGVVPDNIGLL